LVKAQSTGFAVAVAGGDSLGFKQAPGHMGFVSLFAGRGEGCGVLAPAAVGIEAVSEPGGGFVHGVQVGGILVLRRASAQAQQNLAGVEGHGDARRAVDLAALKAALRELDGHTPVQHASGPLMQLIAAGSVGQLDEGGNDVAGGFGVRGGPTFDQAEIPGHTAIGRGRLVLSAAQPGQGSIHAGLGRRGQPMRQAQLISGLLVGGFGWQLGSRCEAADGFSNQVLHGSILKVFGALYRLKLRKKRRAAK
jgi:hypothetical protein